MLRIVATLLIILALGGDVQAKNPFDELSRALDEINRALNGELQGGSSTRAETTVTTTTGICRAVKRNLEEMFAKRCQAEMICNINNDCDINYRWDKTWMITKIRGGKPVSFINAPVQETIVEGQPCLAAISSNWIFCFIEDETSETVSQEAVNREKTDESARRQAELLNEREQQLARAAERKRQTEIAAQKAAEAEERGRIRREKEAERKRAEEEERRKAEAEEKARLETEAARKKAEAELQEKKKLITELITPAEVERFFKGKSLSILAPVDAAGACRDHFMPHLVAIASPAPVEMLDLLKSNCRNSATNYGQREATKEGERRAGILKNLPATLESLRQNNWFLFDESGLKAFPSGLLKRVSDAYYLEIEEHRNKALVAAESKIRVTFNSAAPLAKSADDVWSMCDLSINAPSVLKDVCKNARAQFGERISKARCDRSIALSSVSRKLLNMAFEASGWRYESRTLRSAICWGVKKKPEYRIVVNESWFPGLTPTTMTIINGETTKLLEVELRISTPRDGRSFAKLLLDIATGENEKPVPETLVVDKIRFIAPEQNWSNADSVVGCVLNFIDCG